MARFLQYLEVGDRERSGTETGALLFELILVAPFILFLIGYIVRLTMILQAQQISMTLSRELATTIFRGCADLTIQQQQNSDGFLRIDTTQSASAIATCLNNARQDMLNRWQSLRPIGAPESSDGVTLNLAVYRHGFSSLSPAESCPCSGGDCSITIISHDGTANADPIDENVMCQRNRVVRVLLQFPVEPLFAFLNLIPGASLSNTIQIREETII